MSNNGKKEFMNATEVMSATVEDRFIILKSLGIYGQRRSIWQNETKRKISLPREQR